MDHSAHAGHGSMTSGGASSMAGMDHSIMSMDHGMTPYLHFTGSDYIFFSAWRPSSAGAIAGACIGLFFVALFERWFASVRGNFEQHWKQRAFLIAATRSGRPSAPELGKRSSLTDSSSGREKELESAATPIPSLIPLMRSRTIPPFIAAQDIPRGIIYGFHMFVGYLLMLAVMSYHAGIIIAIVVGLGLGEMIFCREHTVSGH